MTSNPLKQFPCTDKMQKVQRALTVLDFDFLEAELLSGVRFNTASKTGGVQIM